MRLEKETLQLDCILTDKEIMDAARELGGLRRKIRRNKDDLSAYKKNMGAEISSLEGRLNIIGDMLDTGKERRAIECKIVYDWFKKEKVWFRVDTGEIALVDIILESDLQEHFRLENENKAPDETPVPEAAAPEAEAEQEKPKASKKKALKEKIQADITKDKPKAGKIAEAAPILCAVHGTLMSNDQCYRCWKKGEGDINTINRVECKGKNRKAVEQTTQAEPGAPQE